jgi:hypothetical protein
LETSAWADQAGQTVDLESLSTFLKPQYQQNLQCYNDAIAPARSQSFAHLNPISPQLVNEISASDKQLPTTQFKQNGSIATQGRNRWYYRQHNYNPFLGRFSPKVQIKVQLPPPINFQLAKLGSYW